MNSYLNIREQFLAERQRLFNNKSLYEDAFKFCIKYSLLVEEFILKAIRPQNLNCVLTAVGGFGRRELSPYSDIDLMFIVPKIENYEENIDCCIRMLSDIGIEVSYKVREFSDIERFLNKNLHVFTQFFETRFLWGDKSAYDQWNANLFNALENCDKEKLIYEYFDDIEDRYNKYGRSSKVLEPNLKFTAGGLRDVHAVEWMFSVKNYKLLSGQDEITQTEIFLKELLNHGIVNRKAYKRLFESYKKVLQTRNLLHLIEKRKNDRLEFSQQKEIAKLVGYNENNWKEFMHEYFRAATILNRFSKTMMKRYKQEFSTKLSEYLSINIDDDFEVIGDLLIFKNDVILSISDIMRAFYYRCVNDARFEKNLRSLIIESIHLIEETHPIETTSSVFFREILKLPANVGKTFLTMNEFSFLNIFLPEFKELNGFFEPGVYHCYTADEHTLIALQNLEKLSGEDNHLARIYKSLPSKDILYLAVLLHDIGKPISVVGHEILGAEIANTIMQNLGYGQSEIMLVQFLVRNHIEMQKVAFKRDQNDHSNLDGFISSLPSLKALDHLYLLCYADLSAVNPQILTQWKVDLLKDLYSKAKDILLEQMAEEELISAKSKVLTRNIDIADEGSLAKHLDKIDDLNNIFSFSEDEISQSFQEIKKGAKVSVFLKNAESFTNISVITKDSPSLLAKLCGIIAINGLNIHDIKIFTRRDGIVIDSFNVTNFMTDELIKEAEFKKIEDTIYKAISDDLNMEKEFKEAEPKWQKFINKDENNTSKVEITFERHNKYTMIDILAPNKLRLLYIITQKMFNLGLTIAFAKIFKKEEGVFNTFYILKNNGEKLRQSEYGFISSELSEEIKKIL